MMIFNRLYKIEYYVYYSRNIDIYKAKNFVSQRFMNLVHVSSLL